jgi:hypothetical protein
MGVPISIRLDEDVRQELEAQAQSRGVGLATLLRDLATQAARQARRARIRADSGRVAAHAAGFAEGQALFEEWGGADWGAPRKDAG